MASVEGRGLARRVLAHTALPARFRFTAAAICASGTAGLLEGVALAWGCPSLPTLAAGTILTVLLSWHLGGAGLVQRYAEAVRDLAVDDVTDVWSRRAFASDLPAAVTAAGDGGRPLTLALVELTNVAGAVELFGRRRVEVLIREAATTLQTDAGARPGTYRLSGEVFAVVLPGVGPDAAFDVVDTLLTRIARAAAPLCAIGGLATLDARCPDAEMLLVGASAALDEARALGPGRVAASADPDSGLRWLATPG